MIKKYFLWAAPPGAAAMLTGSLVALALLILYAGLGSSAGSTEQPLLAIVFASGLGLVVGVVTFAASRAYVDSIWQHITDDFRPDLLIRVDGVRVVDFGKTLWRPGPGEIFPINTSVYGWDPAKIRARARLEDIGPGKVTVNVMLEAVVHEEDVRTHGLDHGFDPQELYDRVIRPGHRRVSDMLAFEFNRMVLRVLKAGVEEISGHSKDPAIVAGFLSSALRLTNFRLPLSNFVSLEAWVELDKDDVKVTYGW